MVKVVPQVVAGGVPSLSENRLGGRYGFRELLGDAHGGTLELFDIAAISELTHRYGALVAIYNTFASYVNQRPLELGANLTVYSATKQMHGFGGAESLAT